MSGHSHFSTIKHKKGAADAQRSKLFSKFAKEITIAAKDGSDPSINTRLRAVIEKARGFNMPTENIERAIGRAVGNQESAQLQEVLLEAYGPTGIAILIQGITDNKNRMLGEIKQTLSRHQGKLVEGGAVRWLFDRKGALTINPESQTRDSKHEEIELKAIEAGAEDLRWREDGLLDVYTNPPALEHVKTGLLGQGLNIESVSLDWVPKEQVAVSGEIKTAAEKLFEELGEHDDVQEIYSNLKA